MSSPMNASAMPSVRVSATARARGNAPILLHGPSRHRVRTGRGRPPAVPHRRRQGVRAGLRRHEGGARDQRLRHRRPQEVRRGAGPGHGAVHRRRGDRLAVLEGADHEGGAFRACRLQQRARPAGRRRRHRAQGRRVHAPRRHRQGGACRQQSMATASAPSKRSRARSQGCMRSPTCRTASAAMSARSAAARPSTRSRPTRARRSICVSSSPPTARGPWRQSKRSSRKVSCRAPRRGSRSPASSIRWSRARRRSASIDHYAACAAALGQTVEPMFAGGCSDAGFAASAGAPTICAVGPVGGRAHSPDEYLEIDSIVPRAQALALAIMRLEGM